MAKHQWLRQLQWLPPAPSMGDSEVSDDLHKRLLVGGDDGDYGPTKLPWDPLVARGEATPHGKDSSGGGGSHGGGMTGVAEDDLGGAVKDDDGNHEESLAPAWQRKMVALLVAIGVFCQYAMRSNISVAMTSMPDRWVGGWRVVVSHSKSQQASQKVKT